MRKVWNLHGTHATPDMSAEQARKAMKWEKPAFFAAMLVTPYLLLNYYMPDGWDTITKGLYVGLWVFFLAEALRMLWLAPSNAGWVKSNIVDVVLLAGTAPVIIAPFMPERLEVLQVLWLIRIFDLLPVVDKHFFQVTKFKFGIISWVVTVLGGGLAYASVEKVPSLLDALYWANTTVSTVGYGDYSPQTVAGKWLTMPMQALGVVVGAIFVAGIIDLFNFEFNEGFEGNDN